MEKIGYLARSLPAEGTESTYFVEERPEAELRREEEEEPEEDPEEL